MNQLSVASISRVATGGLVAAVWQGALLSLAVGLVLRLLPKTPAAVRFAIWFGVFAIVSVLPFAGFFHRGAVAQGHAPWLTLDPRWCLVAAGAWGMASLMRAVTLMLAVFRVRSLWKRATPLKVEGTSFVGPTHRDDTAMNGASRVNGGAGYVTPEDGRRAELCVSDEVDRPTVIGFFAPKILIPAWLVEKLTAAELDQIVLHEAGHLSRADDWMNLLQKVALVVFPLNPALAWVERRLCFERELACDEHVLRTTGAPKAYAACLASLAEHRLGRRSSLALALGALGRESELGRRVGRILRRGEMMRPAHARLVLGGAMLTLLTAAAGLDRCPQLVGFAEPAVNVAGFDHATGDLRAPRYGYQQVAFDVPARSGSDSATSVRVDHGGGVLLKASSALSASPAYRMHAIADQAAFPAGPTRATNVSQVVSQSRNAPANAAVVRWVVVTAWQREDGSRVVLTSEQISDATGRVVRMQSVAEPVQMQDQDQVHPYAAVPVQNGWLVFQL
jgi:hypothetical protein